MNPKLNVGGGAICIPCIERTISIPKVIHQTYGGDILPQTLLDNINAIKRLNPGWVHKIYNDEDIFDFIQKYYPPDVLRKYLKINPKYGAARADLFRYLLIYCKGGVYLDIKSTLERPLDDVLEATDQFILSTWVDDATPQYAGWGLHTNIKDLPNGEFQQWHVAAAAGHPFLKSVIDAILNNIDIYDPYLHGIGKPGVLNLTGPIAYSLAIAPLLTKYEHRIVKSKTDLGFVYTILGETEGHSVLFKNHYMQQTAPIINASKLRRFILLSRYVANKAVRKFF